MNGISCRKCAEFSPEEMRPYKREFQYQGCKLQSLLNSLGFQAINLYIYIYLFTFMVVNRWILFFLPRAYFPFMAVLYPNSKWRINPVYQYNIYIHHTSYGAGGYSQSMKPIMNKYSVSIRHITLFFHCLHFLIFLHSCCLIFSIPPK